jgi:hypothetical protein
LTDKYLAIVVLVATAGYLVLRRLIRPADTNASRQEAGRLFASLTDEEQEVALTEMRAAVKKGGEKRD